MDMAPLIAHAAGVVAEIHHSHGIKAALSVAHLARRFPHWTDALWHDALTRAGWFDAPVVDRPAVTAGSPVRPERARIAIARGVLPRAYDAIRVWADARGGDEVVRFYLDQAATDPGYLGHRLSILLALGEAWPLYRDAPQRTLYLDRLTEYLIACRFAATTERTPAAAAVWDDACQAALRRPGFFGHHLITLAWIGRRRGALSATQLQGALGWVVTASATTYADDEDNVTVVPAADADPSEAALEQALRELLLRGTPNIHLLTLADAIAWLWDELAPSARPSLLAIARLHVAGDAAG